MDTIIVFDDCMYKLLKCEIMTKSSKLYFFIFSIVFLLNFSVYAQRINQKWQDDLSYRKETAILELTDETYDIKHYHIDVAYIEGSVLIVADAVEDLSSIDLDPNSAYAINTIKGASSFTFSNDEIILYYWAIT